MSNTHHHGEDRPAEGRADNLDPLSIRDIRSLDRADTAALTDRLVRRARIAASSMGGHAPGGSGFAYSDSGSQWTREHRPEPEPENPKAAVDDEDAAEEDESR